MMQYTHAMSKSKQTLTPPPTPRATPTGTTAVPRTIRVEDELWDAAKVRAAADGLPVSEVVRYYLRAYVDSE